MKPAGNYDIAIFHAWVCLRNYKIVLSADISEIFRYLKNLYLTNVLISCSLKLYYSCPTFFK